MINILHSFGVVVLIDADNTQLSHMTQVLNISEYYGPLKSCLAYGDWKRSPLSSWRDKISSFDITPIQQDRNGKNATDYRLMIEAGEILGEDEFYDFIIVSGDGDFTLLCEHIKQKGRKVIGFGNRKHTAESFRESCDKFYYLEDLENELSKLKKLHPIPPDELRKFFVCLIMAYHQLPQKDGWVHYGDLGKKLRERSPNFESRFGKYKLSELLRNLNEDFESHEQMIRRIDRYPDSTRINLMLDAYFQTRRPDGLAHLGQFGQALRELDPNFESRFSSKKLSEWLEAYPHVFKTHENYVCLADG